MMFEKAMAYIAIPSLIVPITGVIEMEEYLAVLSIINACHCHIAFFNPFMLADQKMGFLLQKQEMPLPNTPVLTSGSPWFPLTTEGILDARTC